MASSGGTFMSRFRRPKSNTNTASLNSKKSLTPSSHRSAKPPSTQKVKLAPVPSRKSYDELVLECQLNQQLLHEALDKNEAYIKAEKESASAQLRQQEKIIEDLSATIVQQDNQIRRYRTIVRSYRIDNEDQVYDLADQINRLETKVEELEYELEVYKEDTTNQISELEERLTWAENTASHKTEQLKLMEGTFRAAKEMNECHVDALEYERKARTDLKEKFRALRDRYDEKSIRLSKFEGWNTRKLGIIQEEEEISRDDVMVALAKKVSECEAISTERNDLAVRLGEYEQRLVKYKNAASKNQRQALHIRGLYKDEQQTVELRDATIKQQVEELKECKAELKIKMDKVQDLKRRLWKMTAQLSAATLKDGSQASRPASHYSAVSQQTP